MIVLGGVLLPDFPAGLSDSYTNALVGRVTPENGGVEYYLVAIPDAAVAIPAEMTGMENDMVGCLTGGYAMYAATEAAEAWTSRGGSASEQFSIPLGTYGTTVYELLWSSHDILTVNDVDEEGNPVLEGVYFFAAEIEAERKYWAPESWFVRLAGLTRKMAGVGKKLVREDILYWLGRVSFIPQGHAYGTYEASIEPYTSTCGGRNPEYQVRQAEGEPMLLSGLKYTSTARAVEEET